MIPRDEYTDQQLKNGEQIESDSLQVSSNPTTTPVDSVPMDVAEPQQTTNLKISDNVESTKDLMCTPFTCVQTVDVNSSLTKSSSVQTSMSHLNSSLNSEASGFCSKLHAGSGDPSNLCSQAETIVTYKSSSPISSHCVYDHNTETVKHQDLKSNLETDFNTPDILGLAHGLITGNHMQHLPLKLTNTLQE
uniref:Uncharacterized protein n=1 Tax=Ciona savignyi TaxID=51511 RepID=H2YRJ5_CIOSA